jgi:predicted porin
MKFTVIVISLFFTTSQSIAENNYSVEAILGSTTQEDNTFSGSDISLGIRAGYQFNQYFTLELGYQDYGVAKLNTSSLGTVAFNQETNMSDFNLGFKAHYQLSNGASLFGKLGVSVWEYKSSVFNSPLFDEGTVLVRESTGADAYYGLGILYDFNERVFLTMEYSIMKADTSYDTGEINTPNLNVIISSYRIESSNEITNTSVSIGVRF